MSKPKPEIQQKYAAEFVGAQWTVVDEFERHGEKYVVLRDNRSSPVGRHALTATERSVVQSAAQGLTTKEIAYQLGITDTTVRVLLMRAARRCAVGSRRELLDLWRHY